MNVCACEKIKSATMDNDGIFTINFYVANYVTMKPPLSHCCLSIFNLSELILWNPHTHSWESQSNPINSRQCLRLSHTSYCLCHWIWIMFPRRETSNTWKWILLCCCLLPLRCSALNLNIYKSSGAHFPTERAQFWVYVCSLSFLRH